MTTLEAEQVFRGVVPPLWRMEYQMLERLKKMKKLMLIGIGVMGLSMAGICGEGTNACATAPAAPAAPKVEKKQAPKKELKDISVTGTIQKKEATSKDGKVTTRYTVVAEDGTAYSIRPAKKGAPGSNVADLVGAKVKVVGKGETGAKHNSISVITSLDKAE